MKNKIPVTVHITSGLTLLACICFLFSFGDVGKCHLRDQVFITGEKSREVKQLRGKFGQICSSCTH